MRYWLIAAAIGVVSCSYAEVKKDPLIGRRHFILDVEYAYLKRAPKIHNKKCLSRVESSSSSSALGDLPGCARGKCKFNTTDILKDQGSTSGIRLTANYLTDRHTTWQARYLGMLDWHGSDEAACINGLEFPFEGNVNNTQDYQNANRMKGTCDTDFWSTEFNYWYHVTPQRVDMFSVSWVFGLRYLSLKEHFNLLSQTNYGASNYKIETKNRMGCVQLGGDFEGNLGINFTWGIVAKMGAVVDFAQNCMLLRDVSNTQTISNYNPSDFNMSFLGEIGPFITFNLFKNLWFKMSYELIYLSNVALAMNQITYREENVSDLRNHVNIGGSFMCYGLYIGLGFDF